jgi:hypothetical protein
MANDEKQVVFNCPVKLLEIFDEKIKGRYSNRTHGLCAAMQLLLDTLKEA